MADGIIYSGHGLGPVRREPGPKPPIKLLAQTFTNRGSSCKAQLWSKKDLRPISALSTIILRVHHHTSWSVKPVSRKPQFPPSGLPNAASFRSYSFCPFAIFMNMQGRYHEATGRKTTDPVGSADGSPPGSVSIRSKPSVHLDPKAWYELAKVSLNQSHQVTSFSLAI